MKRAWIPLAMLFAAGCGGNSADPSTCDKLETAATAMATSAAPCFSTSPSLPFTAAQCRSSISMCSDSDAQRIADFTTCLGQLPTCTVATATTWSASLQACGTRLGGLAGSGC